jgi:anhydro-N-acetylmuramic acid kinase
VIVAGVLSGTSLDGIDVALVELRPRARRLLTFATLPFPAELRARILAAYPPAPLDALAVAALHADVGSAFGAAVVEVAGTRPVALVGSHGVTLAHDGAAPYTLQIGDAFRIRERTACSVAFDFRAADCAAGGTGAPLVPHLDVLEFSDPVRDRVALNLGGIANLTVLPAGGGPVAAFDSGPANLPIDSYVAAREIGNGRFDAGGAGAARGRADPALLAQWLADPYFAARPPKSTGRERFGAPFIAAHRARLDALPADDALATLTSLSIASIAEALERFAPAHAEVIVSGGGVHNATLMAGLRAALPHATFRSSAELGIDPDAKEALLFAVLAHELVRGRPANVPNVTGARGPRLLGALAPYDAAGLAALLRAEEE